MIYNLYFVETGVTVSQLMWEEVLLKCTTSHSGATQEFSAKQYKVHIHTPVSLISL